MQYIYCIIIIYKQLFVNIFACAKVIPSTANNEIFAVLGIALFWAMDSIIKNYCLEIALRKHKKKGKCYIENNMLGAALV